MFTHNICFCTVHCNIGFCSGFELRYIIYSSIYISFVSWVYKTVLVFHNKWLYILIVLKGILRWSFLQSSSVSLIRPKLLRCDVSVNFSPYPRRLSSFSLRYPFEIFTIFHQFFFISLSIPSITCILSFLFRVWFDLLCRKICFVFVRQIVISTFC